VLGDTDTAIEVQSHLKCVSLQSRYHQWCFSCCIHH